MKCYFVVVVVVVFHAVVVIIVVDLINLSLKFGPNWDIVFVVVDVLLLLMLLLLLIPETYFDSRWAHCPPAPRSLRVKLRYSAYNKHTIDTLEFVCLLPLAPN